MFLTGCLEENSHLPAKMMAGPRASVEEAKVHTEMDPGGTTSVLQGALSRFLPRLTLPSPMVAGGGGFPLGITQT